jgi:hypothetical protein
MRTARIFGVCLPVVVVGAVDPVVDLIYSKYGNTTLPKGVIQWLGIRYAACYPSLSPIFIVGTDVPFEQAPPLGKLRFAALTTLVYNSTVQKATKLSSWPRRQSVRGENAENILAWHIMLSQSS